MKACVCVCVYACAVRAVPRRSRKWRCLHKGIWLVWLVLNSNGLKAGKGNHVIVLDAYAGKKRLQTKMIKIQRKKESTHALSPSEAITTNDDASR